MSDHEEEYDNMENELIVVFPKEFEFHKFMMTIKIYSVEVLRDLTKLVFDCNGLKIMNVIVIHDSDIGFTLKLNNLMNKYRNSLWLMIGSCGIDHVGVDDDITILSELGWSKSFWVSKAYKFDRGELLGRNNAMTFKERSDKRLSVEILKSLPLKGVTGDVYCSNNLMLSSNDDHKIYDMESYEFIKMGQINDVKVIGVLRIITDICSYTNNKLMRICTSFKSVYDVLIDNSFIFTTFEFEDDEKEGDPRDFFNSKHFLQNLIINQIKVKGIDDIQLNLRSIINNYGYESGIREVNNVKIKKIIYFTTNADFQKNSKDEKKSIEEIKSELIEYRCDYLIDKNNQNLFSQDIEITISSLVPINRKPVRIEKRGMVRHRLKQKM